MGLIALLFSVVADAIWPLGSRSRVGRFDDPDDEAGFESDMAEQADETSFGYRADPAPTGSAAASAAGSSGAEREARSRPDSGAESRAGHGAESGAGDAGFPAHPLRRAALRLIDWMSGDWVDSSRTHGRYLSAPGWIGVVGIPVLTVALVEAALSVLGGFLVFVLHVFVLYLSVGLGRFYRRFMELQLLIGAGEERSARLVLARWIGTRAPDADGADGGSGASGGSRLSEFVRRATAESLLAAYRDVFAPIFWYLVLPGAIGPVLYLFARFAACHSHPFARTAYHWLDWIPLRLASLGLALAGQFEDAVFCLRAVGGIRPALEQSADPFLHQRLLLLPVAGGALGLRLTDAGVDAQLRLHAPDLELPAADAEPLSLRPMAGLLLRSSFIWVGLYLLVKLLD